jgi:hypothetical protein
MANTFYGQIELWKASRASSTTFTCAILGVESKDNFILGGLFSYSAYISPGALLLANYLGFKFDTKDHIKRSISERDKVIDLWNQLYKKLDDDDDDLVMNAACFDFWDDDIKFKATLDKILSSESKAPSKKTSEDYYGKVFSFYVGNRVALEVVFHEDRISILGMTDVFYVDMLGFSLEEPTFVSSDTLASAFIELKGSNRTKTFAFPYRQIKDMEKLKELIDSQLRKVKRSETQGGSNNSMSVADELIKLSKLKEGGIISEDEFLELKKKLL